MPDGEEKARQLLPFSSFDSDKPEDLWAWLEETSERVGTDFVAIPHNSNISGGMMFDEVDSEGRPITAEYARMRMRWEPVVEVTQIKGDSETHPKLSPNDELADFETYTHLAEGRGRAGRHRRGRLRSLGPAAWHADRREGRSQSLQGRYDRLDGLPYGVWLPPRSSISGGSPGWTRPPRPRSSPSLPT